MRKYPISEQDTDTADSGTSDSSALLKRLEILSFQAIELQGQLAGGGHREAADALFEVHKRIEDARRMMQPRFNNHNNGTATGRPGQHSPFRVAVRVLRSR